MDDPHRSADRFMRETLGERRASSLGAHSRRGRFSCASEHRLFVSLRDSQVRRIADPGRRGAAVARLVSDPNRFLAVVQIGVTLTALLSSAYGRDHAVRDGQERPGPARRAVRRARRVRRRRRRHPDHLLRHAGARRARAQAARPAAGRGHRAAGRPRSSTGWRPSSRPVIWLLSTSTNLVVRLLGGDPNTCREEITAEEVRALVAGNTEIAPDERRPHRGGLRGRRTPAARGARAAHRGGVPRRGTAGARPRRASRPAARTRGSRSSAAPTTRWSASCTSATCSSRTRPSVPAASADGQEARSAGGGPGPALDLPAGDQAGAGRPVGDAPRGPPPGDRRGRVRRHRRHRHARGPRRGAHRRHPRRV